MRAASARKNRKKESKSSADLRLETLDRRVLLNASTDFMGPILPDASVDDASGDVDTHADFTDQNYASVSTVVLNEDNATHPFACTCPACAAAQAATDEQEQADSELESSVDDYTESLASYSGGTQVLYLDFDGERVYSRSGDFYLGSDYIDVPAFSLADYGWGGQELTAIEYVAEFIREDYAAYDIVVTTTEPTSGEYTTMYVGGTADWFMPNSNIIGLASYDPGNRDASNFGFAFSDSLASYAARSGSSLQNFSEYLGNLISHEAAHTFGANHVSDTSAIMNPYLPFSPRTTMFGEGYVPGTSQYQDTQSLLGSNIGYAGNSDDFGDSISTSYEVSAVTVVNGILERRDDSDAFTFTSPASGAALVDLSTTSYGNLDAVLTVYDASGAIVASNDAIGRNDPILTFNASSNGDYTVVVSSSGGDSSGSYLLNITAPTAKPELELTDSIGSATDLQMNFGTIEFDGTSTATITLANSGNADLVISKLVATGYFELSQTSVSSSDSDDIAIAPGTSETISVTYDPQTIGVSNGVISLTTNDTENTNITLALTGTALAPAPEMSLTANDSVPDDSTLDFGQLDYQQSASRTITINNTGNAVLNLTGLTITGPFSIRGNAQTISVGPGQSSSLIIDVDSENTGELSGNLTFATNDSSHSSVSFVLDADVDEPEQAIVAGPAEDEPVDTDDSFQIVELDGSDDNLVSLGAAQAGRSHIMGVYQLVNDGDSVRTFNLALDDNSEFSIIGPASITLQPGQSYNVNVQLNAAQPRACADTLTVSVDGLSQAVAELSAEPFALFGDGEKFSFVDKDGDEVTVSLSGDAQGRITLGRGDEADIKSIELLNGEGSETLAIKVKGLATELGSLIGSGSLKAIKAKDVDLSGLGIALEGTLDKVQLGDILNDAGISFATDADDAVNMSLGLITGASEIIVDGAISKFVADGFLGGLLKADSIGKITIAGDLVADLDIAEDINKLTVKVGDILGDIGVGGELKKLKISAGDLIGDLTANFIKSVKVSDGDIEGIIDSVEEVASLVADNVDKSNISSFFAKTDDELDNVLANI